MDGLIAGGLRAEEAAAPYRVAPLLTGHLDTFASAPEGFKRLRELVLNLAVRGRLVPQDPKDEPVEYVIKTKKTRTGGEQQSPFMQLPLGWAFVRLSELGDFSGGKTPSTNNSAYWGGTIPWVTPKDMKFSEIFDTQDHVSELALRDGLNLIEAGSVLIVVRSGILRRMLPVAIVRTRCTVNQDLKALRLVQTQMAAFVQLLLLGHERWILENLTKTGTTVESVKFDELAECRFPLPPPAEQSRIVAKVKDLMALIDALEAKVGAGETARGKLLDALLAALADSPDAVATADAWAQLAPHFDLLLQTPADVDRLQQTLLQLAVKGRLVPQDPKDEPAAELLKRIRAEKARLVTAGNIKRENTLPVVGEDELTHEAPPNWEKVRLAEIAHELCTGPFGSALHKQDYVSGGIPLINPSHLRNGLIQPEADVSVTHETSERLSSYRLSNGDIILARRGEVGRCAIVTAKEEGWLCGTGSFFLKLPTMIDRDFLYLLFQSPDIRRYLSEGAVGATMVNLNQRILVMMPIGLPPLPEQSRIVAAVASLTALCDRLRERLAARRALSAKLATALTESALQ